MGTFGSPTQIIWTSSSNAKEEAFSIDDIQHKNGYFEANLCHFNELSKKVSF